MVISLICYTEQKLHIWNKNKKTLKTNLFRLYRENSKTGTKMSITYDGVSKQVYRGHLQSDIKY